MTDLLFQPSVLTPDINHEANVVVVGDNTILRPKGNAHYSLPLCDVQSLINDGWQTCFLGFLADKPYYTLWHQHTVNLPNWQTVNFRQQLAEVGPAEFNLLCYAQSIAYWQREHQFCSRCAKPLQHHASERAKVCHDCNKLVYPKVAPCAIVAITRDQEILLARSSHFPPGRYSCIAGFVDPGESAEETAVREAKEEVNIDITNLKYLGSQPWPFPSQLMLGFIADYQAGEIICQEQEIEDAGWYTLDNLPDLPPAISLSRIIIEHAIDSIKAKR